MLTQEAIPEVERIANAHLKAIHSTFSCRPRAQRNGRMQPDRGMLSDTQQTSFLQ